MTTLLLPFSAAGVGGGGGGVAGSVENGFLRMRPKALRDVVAVAVAVAPPAASVDADLAVVRRYLRMWLGVRVADGRATAEIDDRMGCLMTGEAFRASNLDEGRARKEEQKR